LKPKGQKTFTGFEGIPVLRIIEMLKVCDSILLTLKQNEKKYACGATSSAKPAKAKIK
jgi:hypothetical protein